MFRQPPADRLETFRQALSRCWSLNSSSRWTAENPALGQCGVTALVVHDLFGGEILKTSLGDGVWHFYNRIDGERHDFTASQFDTPLVYEDEPSHRDEAFGDTNAQQYGFLSEAVSGALLEG